MSSQLSALLFDARDPGRLARFWAGVLDRKLADDGVTVLPSDKLGFPIRFLPSQAEKTGPNQMHFDLTSASPEDMQQKVARVLELGGRHLDIGQDDDIDHVVLADPEDNEFCVIEPENNFLADTDVIGALSSDGSQQVGYFWSEALGWPLVWDQDEETAIQSPLGGSKISWGGPPVNPKLGKNRLGLELAAENDHQAEVDRLVALGATRAPGNEDDDRDDSGDDGRVPMLDPDGNEFWLLARRSVS